MAAILRGKHRPYFAPHVDTGDHVIVVNADKVDPHLEQGRRQAGLPPQRLPRRPALHHATPSCSAEKPAELIRRSVRGMLPKNTLGRQMLGKLQVYAGPDHPHSAQKPETLELPQARRAG